MKLFIPVLFSLIIFLGACKNDSKNSDDNDSLKIENVDSSKIIISPSPNADDNVLGKEYTSKYICPMHCKGSGSDKSGTCPECGMEYIENLDYKNE